MEKHNIVITPGSLMTVLLFALGIYLVVVVRDVLMALFVSLLLAALIEPLADWFQKRKIPRGVAVLLIYVALFGFVTALILSLAPIITSDLPRFVSNLEETGRLVQAHPAYTTVVSAVQSVQTSLAQFQGSEPVTTQVDSHAVGETLTNVYSTITGFFGGVISVILVLVITFYLVVQEDPLGKIVKNVVPDQQVPYVVDLVRRIKEKLGAWVRGQLFLSAIIGGMTFVGLVILDVRYALLLALFAGLFEFIPYFGPTVSAIPALLLAFTQGGAIKALFVLLLYFTIQWIENNIIVPKVMQQAVGLNPVVSIVAILAGVQLAGVAGALLAIPVATALSVYIHDIVTVKHAKE